MVINILFWQLRRLPQIVFYFNILAIIYILNRIKIFTISYGESGRDIKHSLGAKCNYIFL